MQVQCSVLSEGKFVAINAITPLCRYIESLLPGGFFIYLNNLSQTEDSACMPHTVESLGVAFSETAAVFGPFAVR